MLIFISVYEGRVGQTLQGFLLFLAHDQCVVKAIHGCGWFTSDGLAHDLLVVEGRYALLVELLLGVVRLLMWAWTVFVHVELKGVALPDVLALPLSSHHEVLILLSLVLLVMDAGAATLLALLHGQVHQLGGLSLIIVKLSTDLVVSVLIICGAVRDSCQVAIRQFIVLLRRWPLPALLVLHLEFVVLHDVGDRHVARLLFVLH